MNQGGLLLEMCGIGKNFGPVAALRGVNLRIRSGTVHALCGENGAGKSTLMKILAGVYAPDEGFIEMDGLRRVFAEPRAALKAGISMLYQELDLAPDLTVTENLFLGEELLYGPFLRRAAMREAAEKLIAEHGFMLDPDTLVCDLSVGECQIVELLRAIRKKARLVVMDEPTSALSDAESKRLFALIGRLRASGVAIVYISHRMEEIMELADEISILRDGALVYSGNTNTLTLSDIVRHMAGRDIADFYPPHAFTPGPVILRAEKLGTAEGIRDITFELRRGTITGLAGLVGAGRTEIARALFGLARPTAGRILLEGREVRFRSPGDAIDRGLALLTEDRRRSGLCANLLSSWNMELPAYTRLGMALRISTRRERELARLCGKKLRIKWHTPADPADTLSGGNQQKLLFARWLLLDPDILIVDEPTRGIDVGAKKEIYTLLGKLAAAGKAILMISSDLPELFGVADKLLVIRRGRLVASFRTAETTPEEVMRHAVVEETILGAS